MQMRAPTFHDGTETLPDGQTAAAVVLTECQFQVEEGQAAEEQHDAVGDEESTCHGREGGCIMVHPSDLSGIETLTSAVSVADIGKAPYVSQIDRKSDHRQQELDFLVPVFAFWLIVQPYLVQLWVLLLLLLLVVIALEIVFRFQQGRGRIGQDHL